MMLKEELIRALRELDADTTTRTDRDYGARPRKAFTAGADIQDFQGRTAIWSSGNMYRARDSYDIVDRIAKRCSP